MKQQKISTMSKLKSFANNKINVTEKNQKFLFGWVENLARKGEKLNAAYLHFLLFPQCVPKGTYSGSLKVGTLR